MVIEDAHWADEATLDLLQYLSRRVGSTGALLVVTYRDDVDRTEPISILLGDLASVPVVRRLAVPPLSPAAVAELTIGTDLDPVKLHAETNGNAFFVTEILRQGSTGCRSAWLTRCWPGCDGSARPPARPSRWRGRRRQGRTGHRPSVADIGPLELDECVANGFLLSEGPVLVFRHELARRAVLDSIPPGRRSQLHADVLRGLRELCAEPGLLGPVGRARGRGR